MTKIDYTKTKLGRKPTESDWANCHTANDCNSTLFCNNCGCADVTGTGYAIPRPPHRCENCGIRIRVFNKRKK